MSLTLLLPLMFGQAVYFPGATWERKAPADAGMDAAKLAIALDYAQSHETDMPADFSTQEKIFGKKLGPLPAKRAPTSGLVIRGGYIVGSFGPTYAADPTYSAAKSFLSAVAGIAVRDGLIPSLSDKVGDTIRDGGYDSPHNAKITWYHHLTQASEWQGEMWGKKDDFVGAEAFGSGERKPRDLKEPGSLYEYNDVRINRLSLSLLRVFGRSVPDVLKSEIMDPIGASSTWKWVPYDNAHVTLEGKDVPSVSGGTRWGGGLWISALDEARFGLLFLREGKWAGREILPRSWVQASKVASPTNPDYGLLWWLNVRDRQWPGLPASSFGAVGAGSNTIWIDPEHDLVVVWRWHAGSGVEFFRRVVDAVVK